MEPIALVMLGAEINPLAELRAWEPVQMQVDALLDALRGVDSLSEGDVQRLRCWAQRWRSVPDTQRSWWVRRVVGHSALTTALIVYLDGAQVPGPLRGAAARAWREDYGVDPWLPLFPGA